MYKRLRCNFVEKHIYLESKAHIYWKYSTNEGTEQFYKALLWDDYKLTLRLMESLLKSTLQKKKPGDSKPMSLKTFKEKGLFYNQYVV